MSAGVHVQRRLRGAEHKEDDNIVQGEKKKSKAALASARAAASEEDFKNKMKEQGLMKCDDCARLFVKLVFNST